MGKRGWLLIIFFLLGILVSFGFYFFIFKDRPLVITRVETTGDNNPTPTASSVAVYVHPTFGYSFEIPLNWSVEEVILPDGTTTKNQDITIKSPDYVYDNETDGYPRITSGSEIYIASEPTTETDIEAEFAKDTLANAIAKNKTATNIDGVKAIQYDFSYEGTIASVTAFIKDGVHYFIKLNYPEVTDKTKYWETFASFLYSFKTP